MQIRELMLRNLDERIEEIIQVSNQDQQLVYDEITEYIATESIRRHFQLLLNAIAESPSSNTTEFEVWISGFFGSGKSSFAKLLGYVLGNPSIRGERAAEVFKRQIGDPRISDLVDNINARLPFEVIMFDVQTSREMRDRSEDLGAIMYREMLNHLDYCAMDLTVARLEIDLEGEGKLAEFEAICRQLYEGREWKALRKLGSRLNRASTILHQMDPRTYPAAETWANTAERAENRVSVDVLVKDTIELLHRRRPGKSLAFVIDEVGQYVAPDNAKIENLRAIVETFGRLGQQAVRAKRLPAPIWTIVTGQEKLEEIVSALDSTRIGIAKVQDRFRHRVDLAPADIREVTARRVLSKKPAASPTLAGLFANHQGQLNTAVKLEKSHRTDQDMTDQDFAQYYPYLPHFIDLSIDIVSGLRMQGTTVQHIGGSNRTIIKQVHEMLISDRTHFATREVGALVALDHVYELVETVIASEKQRDISAIAAGFGGHSGWPARVAKAICLLENVKDLPRSERNIAALLISQAGQPAPINEVRQALQQLTAAQYVREHDTGFKLVTALERSWEDERRAMAHPSIGEQNEIRNEVLRQKLAQDLLAVKYNTRTFRVSLRFDPSTPPEPSTQIDLRILAGYDSQEVAQLREYALRETRDPAHTNTIYWIVQISDDSQRIIEEVHASKKMIERHQHDSAQGQLSEERRLMFGEEKGRETRFSDQLRLALLRDLHGGVGIFRGVTTAGGSQGQTAYESVRKHITAALPDIYPNFTMGEYIVGANDIEHFLKSQNLQGLSQVFYATKLVIQQGPNTFIINPDADIAREVLSFLNRQRAQSMTATGKDIMAYFSEGPIYGWDNEVPKLALAALLRNGTVEMTTSGKRIQNYTDPQVRVVLGGAHAYRAASFAPHQPLDRKVLAEAYRVIEALSGSAPEDVNPLKIGAAARALDAKERARVHDALTLARAHTLPMLDVLTEYEGYLVEFAQAQDEDIVKSLAEKGESIKRARAKAIRLVELLTDGHLATIELARAVLRLQYAALSAVGATDQAHAAAESLATLLKQPDLLESVGSIRDHLHTIRLAYAQVYRDRHTQRTDLYREAIAVIKADPQWDLADTVKREDALHSLARCICQQVEIPDGSLVCADCQRELKEVQRDLELVAPLQLAALAAIAKAIPSPTPPTDDGPAWEGTTPRPARKLRAATYFRTPLTTPTEVDAAVEQFRAALLRHVRDGESVTVE